MSSRWTNKARFGLRGQSVVVAALCGLGLACVSVFYSLPRETEWINQSFSESAERSLHQLGASITSKMLTAQYAELYESIDAQLQQRPNWRAIRVTDTRGWQIYPLDDWASNLAADAVLIETPIEFLGKPLGTISLIASFETQIAQARHLLYRQAALQLLALSLLMALVFVLLERAAVRPLRGLMHAFGEMAAGNFKAELPAEPANEVGELIREFQITRQQVQQDRRRLEQLRHDAEAANVAKSNFLASMSHELRTPLNAILGLAELSATDSQCPPLHRQHANHIHAAGEHLLALINNLLDLSAIETGKIQVSLEPLRLTDLARECSCLVEVLAADRGVRCDIELQEIDGALVKADYTRLKQVIFNLLSNAVKYNRPNGRVRLSGQIRPQDRIRLSVQDTGQGLSEAQLAKLFTPFDRLGAELGNIQGSGIGLVITRQLMQQMGGELGVQSTPGQGSTFWIELPLAEPADLDGVRTELESAPPQPAAEQDSSATDTLRILVAEDNPLNREVIRHQLEVLGYTAQFAGDGEEAWRLLQQTTFDLLLTDIQMPRLDGTALVQRIREQEASGTRHLPVLAMTANVMRPDVEHYLACGIDECLAKPTSLQALRRVLDDIRPPTSSPPPLATSPPADHDSADASGAEAADHDALNLAPLIENFGDDPGLFRTFFQSFLNMAPQHVSAIRQALQAQDANAAAREAHALKSTAATLGAESLADSCAKLEDLAGSAQWPAIAALLGTLEAQCDRACAQMREYCDPSKQALA